MVVGVTPSETSPSRTQRIQALLLALCCALGFLREALLPGRALVPYPPEQFDVVRAEAIARGTLDLDDARRGNTGGGDKYLQSLCWDRVMQDRLRAGELPLWTRDIVGGAPFVPQMAQVYEPVNLLLLVLPSTEWYGWWFLLHQVLFGVLCYTFLRRLGCGHAGALLGLVAACLGTWTQCKVHHNVILTAALPLWPMLSAVHDLARARLPSWKRRRTVAWLALWTGISWLSGFAVVSLQVTYLTVGFALLLCWQGPRGERLRGLLPAGIGIALGGLLSFAHMIPVLQASAVSARDSAWDAEHVAFLASHGLEWDHALTLWWPDLLSWAGDHFYPDPLGDPLVDVTRMPWSQLVLLDLPPGATFHNWVETSFAVGSVPLACAAVALLSPARRRAVAVFFAGAGALAFGFALADEPLLSVARFVPGIGAADLRRLLFTSAMALAVLAGLGADGLLRGARRWPALAVLGAAVVGAVVGLWWCGGGDEDAFVRGMAGLGAPDGVSVELAERELRRLMADGEAAVNRRALLVTGLRSLLAGAIGLLAVLLLRGRARPWATLALLAVTILELLHAGLGPVQTVPAERVATPPAVVAPMFGAGSDDGVRPRLARLAAPRESRIASWYPGNLPGYHGLEDATGYNPLPAARFEEFFEAIEPDRDGKADVAFKGAGVGAFHDAASLAHPLCDLFGIRFVLTREPVPPGAGLRDRTPTRTGPFRLFERTTTLPRATFVREIDVLPDRAARLAALSRPDRDVRTRVVLEDARAVKPSPNEVPPANVEILEHRDERVVVRVETQGDGYLRLADPYDAGWRASVDGAPAEVLPADHYLRAVYLPRGEHEVVFTFDAARVVWPRHVSLIVLLLLLGLATGLPRVRT